MRVGLTWLTMGNLHLSLPATPTYAMVERSKSPLDFNAKVGPPEPSNSHLVKLLPCSEGNIKDGASLKDTYLHILHLDDWSITHYMRSMAKREQDTRSHILATGRRLTARQGYSGVGLSELLEKASVPKGSFYHYFPSKEAYGCALLDEFVQEYWVRLGGSLTRPTLNARARILAYFEDWHKNQISTNPEDHCLVVKLSAEVADLSADMSKILHQGIVAIVARLEKTLKAGIAEGSIGPIDDPHALAQAIYHQWLGASLVANLSHDDTALKSALQMTKILVPAPA